MMAVALCIKTMEFRLDGNMNGKIAELAEQCIERIQLGFITQETYFNREKFAESIVRECAGIYEAIDNGNQVEGTDNYIEALRKRFGV